MKTIYPYTDEQGNVLFKKTRTEPGLDGKSKSFSQEREKDGKTIYNLDGCRKPLYQLPKVLAAKAEGKPIFVVEGEKDADNLLNAGLIATTAPITVKWEEEHTQTLMGADAVLLYDNDKAGVERKERIANALYGKAKRLRVVDLPDIEYSENHGKDVSDWLGMGNSIPQLLDLVEKTPDYIPLQMLDSKQELRVVSLDEFFALKLPPREMLLDPFLPSQGLVLIFAKRGVGKTHIASGIAYAVASGGSFLKWKAPAPKKVLYIDGEMPAVLMQERLQKTAAMSDKQHNEDFFKLLTPDLQTQVMPDLSLKEGRDAIEKFIQEFDLIVIDNISCLFRSGAENEAECWQEAQEWALDLRRRGKSVLFVHHAGKSGNQRGTSKREDILDAVIMLKQDENYQPDQGARFDITFDKARHFSGEAARPFQVQLREENGVYHWEVSRNSEEELIEEICHLRTIGYTIDAVVEKTGRTKSQVETLIKKGKSRGINC